MSRIMARIQEIQAHIEQLDKGDAPPEDGMTNVEPPASFSQALQSAQSNGASGLPSIAGVQPLSPNGLTLQALPGAGNYAQSIQQSAGKYGVNPNLISAVVQAESGGNPRAVSPAGAMGLMQLMPANVSQYGVSDPFDPEQNIDAGTHQLADLLSQYNGDLNLALAGYNAGPNAVRRYNGVPPYPETQQYIQKVRQLMDSK
jgi:soluble lytic murein transglycosylase-like protein